MKTETVQLEVEKMVAAQRVGNQVGTQRNHVLRVGNDAGAIQVALAGYAKLEGEDVIVLCINPKSDFGPTKGGKEGPSGRTRTAFLGLTVDNCTINVNAHATTSESRRISSERAKSRSKQPDAADALPDPAVIEKLVAEALAAQAAAQGA